MAILHGQYFTLFTKMYYVNKFKTLILQNNKNGISIRILYKMLNTSFAECDAFKY